MGQAGEGGRGRSEVEGALLLSHEDQVQIPAPKSGGPKVSELSSKREVWGGNVRL